MTSGAAPYVAGAAALLRNWILQVRPSVDPGHIYALLILSGIVHDKTLKNTRQTSLHVIPNEREGSV